MTMDFLDWFKETNKFDIRSKRKMKDFINVHVTYGKGEKSKTYSYFLNIKNIVFFTERDNGQAYISVNGVGGEGRGYFVNESVEEIQELISELQ